MLPRKLTGEDSLAERARWRIVRLDTHATLPGSIVAADCDNGVAVMVGQDGQPKDYSFGPGGIVIISRR